MIYKDEKYKILTEVLGTNYKSGQEILFYCPKCKHHKPKLSINIEKNVFKCWVCDFRGNSLKRLVRRFGDFNQKQEWERFSGGVDISISLEESLFGDLENDNSEQKIELPTEFITLTGKKLPYSAIEPKKYLSSRGISRQDILKWKIGYCKEGFYKNRVLVPSFNANGDVNYFVCRAFDGNRQSYLNPSVSKDIIFNELYVDWKNDLTLVEGVFDAIKTDNGVPLLGSSLGEDSKLFQEILRHDTAIYIALDPDAEKKAFKLIKNLLLYDVELYKVDVSGYKDVGEMTKEEFIERKNNAKSITSETYLEEVLRCSI